MKAYVILLGTTFPSRKAVQDFLGEAEWVGYWYACLPQCIFATSALSASEIAERMSARFPGRRFLVMEANTNRQGILPKKAWYLLRNPASPILPE